MSDENIVTDDLTPGAEALETVTDTEQSGDVGTDDVNPDTGKLYTQAEIDSREAKLRKSLEKQYQKRLNRELANVKPPEQVKTNLEAPKPTDYQTDAEYNRALVRHEIALERQQEAIAKANEAAVKEVSKMISEAANLPGYDHDTIAPYLVDWGDSDVFADALLESPYRAQILEYLSLNEDELEKVDAMSHAKRTAWLGRMETKLEKKPNAQTDQKPNIGAGSSQTGYDLKASSSLEHTKQRAKEGAAWAIRALASRPS